jgi:hypothetical protein
MLADEIIFFYYFLTAVYIYFKQCPCFAVMGDLANNF